MHYFQSDSLIATAVLLHITQSNTSLYLSKGLALSQKITGNSTSSQNYPTAELTLDAIE